MWFYLFSFDAVVIVAIYQIVIDVGASFLLYSVSVVFQCLLYLYFCIEERIKKKKNMKINSNIYKSTKSGDYYHYLSGFLNYDFFFCRFEELFCFFFTFWLNAFLLMHHLEVNWCVNDLKSYLIPIELFI